MGFYKEVQDAEGVTTIQFTKAESAMVEEAKKEELTHRLLDATASGSGAVFSLSGSSSDLERMKQDVLVHSWLSEVDLMADH